LSAAGRSDAIPRRAAARAFREPRAGPVNEIVTGRHCIFDLVEAPGSPRPRLQAGSYEAAVAGGAATKPAL